MSFEDAQSLEVICYQLDCLFDDVPDMGCLVVLSLGQMAMRGGQESLPSELTYSTISTSSPVSAIISLFWI